MDDNPLSLPKLQERQKKGVHHELKGLHVFFTRGNAIVRPAYVVQLFDLPVALCQLILDPELS